MYNVIMNLIKKNLDKFILMAYIIIPTVSFAQVKGGAPCSVSGKICNPIAPINTIQEFIQIFLQGVLRIGIPILALAIIYCGFLFVQAQGKPDELTKAKDTLLYTLIGAAILLGSWAIAILISETVLAL